MVCCTHGVAPVTTIILCWDSLCVEVSIPFVAETKLVNLQRLNCLELNWVIMKLRCAIFFVVINIKRCEYISSVCPPPSPIAPFNKMPFISRLSAMGWIGLGRVLLAIVVIVLESCFRLLLLLVPTRLAHFLSLKINDIFPSVLARQRQEGKVEL